MKKICLALLLSACLASCAAAVKPDVPISLLTGKDQTEYTLDDYSLDETTGRITVVIAGNYPPGGAKQKMISTLAVKHHVPMAQARRLSANLFCFRFNVDGSKFQRVFDRYVDADGELICEARVDTRKWETAKPQLTSGRAYSVAAELLAQQKDDAPQLPPPPKKPDAPAPRSEEKRPPAAGKQPPRPVGAGRAVTAAEWQKLSYAQLSTAVGKNTDLNEFITYTAPGGDVLEGYVLAAVASRRDADTEKILNLLLDRGADLGAEPSVLANYILARGKKADLRLIERLAQVKEQLDPAFIACCSSGAGARVAEKLLDAGASVNEALDPSATVLLEALNLKAEPAIIRMLVERGADVGREGEVYDAKNDSVFHGTPAELARERGYGENVLGLLR